MFSEATIIFPDFKRILLRKDSFLKNKSPNHEMEKMLARKSHIYEKGEISRNIVILATLKGLLKSYMEKVRKSKFNKFQYQQLQVDIYMITQLCYEMASLEDESLIMGFYFEIIDSANERSFDPTPLETTLVETMSNVKRGKLKF